MHTSAHEAPRRSRKHSKRGGSSRLKPRSNARVLAQIRREIRAMTREQWLQSFVEAGIFTPTFRLTAQMRRLDKEGYVYGPRGERPPSLPFFKELSRQLQKERPSKPPIRRRVKAVR